jgi:hypothetical protein
VKRSKLTGGRTMSNGYGHKKKAAKKGGAKKAAKKK